MSHRNVSRPRALIAGIAGQDGSYLAELLVENGYKVLGFPKRNENATTSRRGGRNTSSRSGGTGGSRGISSRKPFDS